MPDENSDAPQGDDKKPVATLAELYAAAEAKGSEEPKAGADGEGKGAEDSTPIEMGDGEEKPSDAEGSTEPKGDDDAEGDSEESPLDFLSKDPDEQKTQIDAFFQHPDVARRMNDANKKGIAEGRKLAADESEGQGRDAENEKLAADALKGDDAAATQLGRRSAETRGRLIALKVAADSIMASVEKTLADDLGIPKDVTDDADSVPALLKAAIAHKTTELDADFDKRVEKKVKAEMQKFRDKQAGRIPSPSRGATTPGGRPPPAAGERSLEQIYRDREDEARAG